MSATKLGAPGIRFNWLLNSTRDRCQCQALWAHWITNACKRVCSCQRLGSLDAKGLQQTCFWYRNLQQNKSRVCGVGWWEWKGPQLLLNLRPQETGAKVLEQCQPRRVSSQSCIRVLLFWLILFELLVFLGSFALCPSCSERVLLILFLVGGFNGVVLMLLNNRFGMSAITVVQCWSVFLAFIAFVDCCMGIWVLASFGVTKHAKSSSF